VRWHPAPVADTAHPLLPPSVPLLRLAGPDGAEDVQIGGADSTDGLLVSPGAAGLTTLLRGLDGRRTERAVLAEAALAGHDAAALSAVLDGLRATGLLVDLDPADLLASAVGPAAAARTQTELPTATGREPGSRWRTRGQRLSSSTARRGSASRSPPCWPPAAWAGSASGTTG